MNIKVGDVIKFKEDMSGSSLYVDAMKEYNGKFNIVRNIVREGHFDILGNEYLWDIDCIEKVYGNYKVGDVFHINNTKCTIENIGFNKRRNEVYFRRFKNGFDFYMGELDEIKEMDSEEGVLKMSKETGFNIGDEVEIIKNGERYDTYSEWFDEIGRKDLRQKYLNTKQHENFNGFKGEVVAKGEHQDSPQNSEYIYAVKLQNEGVILIDGLGIELRENKLKNNYSIKYWELEKGKLYYEENEGDVQFILHNGMVQYRLGDSDFF